MPFYGVSVHTVSDLFTRSQALPGNAHLEALPRMSAKRGRASRYRFPGRALEPARRFQTQLLHEEMLKNSQSQQPR